MPIYEYRCEDCGHTFEKLVRMNAAAPSCPNCEADDVKKLVSAGGFILKGSGWYSDHYGLKGKKSGGSGDGGSSSGDGGGTPSGGSSSGGSEGSSASSAP